MEDWLPLAQALPVGGHQKHPHWCGDGRPLVVFNGDTKWSAYCHRCGNMPPVYKPLPGLRERLDAAAKVAQADAEIERDTRPPQPAVFDLAEWPVEARLWLFKAGFSREEIKQLGAYYHPKSRRVVLPVLSKDCSIQFWQARRIFGSTGAKYLSMPSARKSAMPLYGHGRSVTLTEDILSSFKVATAGFQALALMGTSLNDHSLAWLVANPQLDINIWLDPDRAGLNATGEVQRQLSLVGREVRVIQSARDPKLHSKQEIRHVLGHHAASDDEASQAVRQTYSCR